jgi:hypothetical protein
MALKGSASLPKVYKDIDRFSENIDVTVNYQSLAAPLRQTTCFFIFSGSPANTANKISDERKRMMLN